MIIAVTSKDGEVFQHFGHSEEFTLFEVENGTVIETKKVPTNGQGHGALADFLNIHSVNVVICGGIGGGAKAALREKRIEIVPGVIGKVDEIIIKYLSGEKIGNPNIECNHHHEHGEGHDCGSHSHTCGGHCHN